MARLATLEQTLTQSQENNRLGHAALEKEKKENARLREAIAATQYEEGEETADVDESAAAPDMGVPAMPASFMMTPQKPEGGWSTATEWDQHPANPPGFSQEESWQDVRNDEAPPPNQWDQNGWSGNLQAPHPRVGSWQWAPAAAAKISTADGDRMWPREGERYDSRGRPWCQPAWGTTWQSPQQCDPWAEYSRGQQTWSGGTGGDRYGQWNGGWGSQWSQPLRQPDRKDIDRPAKYAGDITKWLQWSKAFVRFLRRQDGRWPQLLEKVQGLRGRPVMAADETWWSWELNLGDIGQYKDYLNE